MLEIWVDFALDMPLNGVTGGCNGTTGNLRDGSYSDPLGMIDIYSLSTVVAPGFGGLTLEAGTVFKIKGFTDAQLYDSSFSCDSVGLAGFDDVHIGYASMTIDAKYSGTSSAEGGCFLFEDIDAIGGAHLYISPRQVDEANNRLYFTNNYMGYCKRVLGDKRYTPKLVDSDCHFDFSDAGGGSQSLYMFFKAGFPIKIEAGYTSETDRLGKTLLCMKHTTTCNVYLGYGNSSPDPDTIDWDCAELEICFARPGSTTQNNTNVYYYSSEDLTMRIGGSYNKYNGNPQFYFAARSSIYVTTVLTSGSVGSGNEISNHGIAGTYNLTIDNLVGQSKQDITNNFSDVGQIYTLNLTNHFLGFANAMYIIPPSATILYWNLNIAPGGILTSNYTAGYNSPTAVFTVLRDDQADFWSRVVFGAGVTREHANQFYPNGLPSPEVGFYELIYTAARDDLTDLVFSNEFWKLFVFTPRALGKFEQQYKRFVCEGDYRALTDLYIKSGNVSTLAEGNPVYELAYKCRTNSYDYVPIWLLFSKTGQAVLFYADKNEPGKPLTWQGNDGSFGDAIAYVLDVQLPDSSTADILLTIKYKTTASFTGKMKLTPKLAVPGRVEGADLGVNAFTSGNGVLIEGPSVSEVTETLTIPRSVITGNGASGLFLHTELTVPGGNDKFHLTELTAVAV